MFYMEDFSKYGRVNNPGPGVDAGAASDQNGPWNIASAQYHAAYQASRKAAKAVADAPSPKPASGKPGAGKPAAAPRPVGAGPAAGLVATSPMAMVSAGPGNKGAVIGGGTSIGKGAGNAAVLVGPETTQIYIGGKPFAQDAGWSDAGDVEQRWGEGELLDPTWFYKWGVWGADMLAGAAAHARSMGLPEKPVVGNGWQIITDAFAQQDKRWSQDLHRMFGTGVVVPGGGF